MGNIQGECTPHLVKPQTLHGPECCTPQLCGRGLEVVQRALDLGASPNTTAGLTLKMGEPTKGKKRNLHVTPLMRACKLGREDIVATSMEAKASPIQCDSQ